MQMPSDFNIERSVPSSHCRSTVVAASLERTERTVRRHRMVRKTCGHVNTINNFSVLGANIGGHSDSQFTEQLS